MMSWSDLEGAEPNKVDIMEGGQAEGAEEATGSSGFLAEPLAMFVIPTMRRV
jgi:hypothetical protein